MADGNTALEASSSNGWERLLDEARQEARYYQRISEQAGRRRLREIDQLSRLVSELRQTEKALSESEERFRNIAGLSPSPISIIDGNGKYLYVNSRFSELFGYTLDDIPTGGAWFTLAFPDPDYRKEVISHWKSDLERLGKYEVRSHECRVQCKDGTIRDILFRPVTMENGDQFITYEDMTDLRKREEERIKASKLESMGVLAGGIAHDFNNILTAILGNIALARLSTLPGDPVVERLSEAEKACARAKNLTQQLLTFSKGGTPVKKRVRVSQLLKETVHFLLAGSNVGSRLFIPEDLWSAECDEGQISQVINNVILNAQQAMGEGGTVTIEAENVNVHPDAPIPLKEGRYIRISVRDQGPGIPMDILPRIFDPYFTTKQTGNGLGLTSAYSIMTKHGGYITADAAREAGAVFRIYLPASDGKPAAARQEQEMPRRGEGRILVMDDEEIVRDFTRHLLNHLGYTVELAKDGNEAIELYEQARRNSRPFDAVIMDLTIPAGMGGKEAIQKLRKLDPKARAIVSSGYSDDPVMSHFGEHGFDGVIAKPYRAEELAEILHRVIRGGAG